MWGILAVIVVVLAILNIPVMFILGMVGIAYFVLTGIGLQLVPPILSGAVDSFPLLAVPLFILVGNLMNVGGTTKRLFNFARTVVGHLPGGLAYVNIVASIVFAGMSGSSIADAAGLGKVEIKAMLDEGYDRYFSAGITASSSLIGPIMPPSVPMVVVSAVSGASLGRLLIGGIIPALLMGISLAIYVYIVAKKDHYPIHTRSTWKEFRQSFFKAIPALLTPLILLGGIIFGIFTPTEASGVAAFYAMIIGIFFYKELKIKDLGRIFTETVEMTGIVMGLLAVASIYIRVLAFEGIGAKLLAITDIYDIPVWLLLLGTNIILLFSGCFLQVTPSIILLGPMMFPFFLRMGIDPIHLGVVMVLNTVIGTVTPPVASTLYATALIAKIPPYKLFRALIPFLIPILIVLMLCTYIPNIVTLLPNMIFTK